MRRVLGGQVLAIAAIVISFGFVIWLGVISTDANNQPSKSQAVLLVVLAAVFQLSGNYAVSRSWALHPLLIGRAIRSLERIEKRIRKLKVVVELAVDDPDTNTARVALGRTSWQLDDLLDDIDAARTDWLEMRRQQEGSSNGRTNE